jgi:CRP/FNR family transcriptional regulator, anaerobic regulatory protein
MNTQDPSELRFPAYAPAAVEDLLTGGRLLRRAFLEQPYHSIGRQTAILASEAAEDPVILIQRGVAYRSCTLPDGRRAILDLLLPGDIAGVDYAVLGRSNQELTAASALGYRAMTAAALRELMADRTVSMRVAALMAETRWRMDRHMTAITRLDAREQLGLFLLDIYDRLRRRELISRPTFNLPLTQEQIADHLGMTMVHVNRTLRRLREDRLVMVANQVVIITDLDRLRALASGMPPLADMFEPVMPAAVSAAR